MDKHDDPKSIDSSRQRPVRTKKMPQKFMDSSYAFAGDVFSVEELTSKYNIYVNNLRARLCSSFYAPVDPVGVVLQRSLRICRSMTCVLSEKIDIT